MDFTSHPSGSKADLIHWYGTIDTLNEYYQAFDTHKVVCLNVPHYGPEVLFHKHLQEIGNDNYMTRIFF